MYYSLGLGLRSSIQTDVLDYLKSSPENCLIQCLEIVPENYINRPESQLKILEEIKELGKLIIPHSVNLSIGTAYNSSYREDGDKELIKALKDFFKLINPPWFSDHLSCTRIEGRYIPELLPMPFIKESISVISDNIKFLQDEFQLPFLIENPSYYSTLIKAEVTEADFINEILARADCGLLLDINNVYVNSINHNYNARDFLKSLDLGRTLQIHIAGHLDDYQAHLSKRILKILDTHGSAIKDEVYELFQELVECESFIQSQLNKRINNPIKSIILERDSNFPDFNEILNELNSINKILSKQSTTCHQKN